MTIKETPNWKVLPAIDVLLGHEAEIELTDGEVIQGTPIELAFAHGTSAQLMFEETLGEYRSLALDEIGSIRRLAA